MDDEGEGESEAAPLVAKPSGGQSSIAPAARGVEKDSHGHEAPPSKTLAEECRVIFALAWPQSLSFCLSMGAQQANVAFVGHLGATELGASALAMMWCNVTGFSIAYGGLTALDTLGAQAYGAQEHIMVGVLAQRALAIITLLCVPMCGLWIWGTMPLLRLIGVEPDVIPLAALFCRVYSLALWPQLAAAVVQRYLSVQSIIKPYTLVVGIMLPINVAVNALLVFGVTDVVDGLGFVGSALSQVVCSWLLLALLLLMLRVTQLHARCWGGWSRASLQDWGPMLRLGAAGTAGLMGEWWVWEICAAIAGTLGTVPLAAHACLQQLAMLCFVLLDGVAEAATIRVGNMLGAGEPHVARRAAYAVALLTGALVLTVGVGVVTIGGSITRLYTESAEVATLAESIVYYYGVFMISDGFNFSGGSVLRGAAKNSLQAGIVLGCSYGISLPLGIFLCLGSPQWGLRGLWAGMSVGLVVSSLMEWGYALVVVDWTKESEAAQIRAAEQRAHSKSESHTTHSLYD